MRKNKKRSGIKDKPYYDGTIALIKKMHIICSSLATCKKKDEILEVLERHGYGVSNSSLEKYIKVLKEDFDAPIILVRKGNERFYKLENTYNFKKFLTEML